MVRYPQQHLKVLKVSIAMIAMNTIDFLPISFNGNRWALMYIYLPTSYVFTVPMNGKSAKNIEQAYLSNILMHKGGSVTILSNNGTEFKKKS